MSSVDKSRIHLQRKLKIAGYVYIKFKFCPYNHHYFVCCFTLCIYFFNIL